MKNKYEVLREACRLAVYVEVYGGGLLEQAREGEICPRALQREIERAQKAIEVIQLALFHEWHMKDELKKTEEILRELNEIAYYSVNV